MSKIGLIVKREYLQRVRKRSFILLTFLTPLFMVGMVFAPLWLASIKGEKMNIAIIDQTGKYASLFNDTDHYIFHNANHQTLDGYRTSESKALFAILNITGNLLDNPAAAALYSEKQIPEDLSRLVNQILTKQMESDKLASFHIPGLENMIKESRISFNIQTFKWGKDGEESSSSTSIARIIGIFSTFAIYMFIMMYGSMVMQGVTEEKTNRIMEIMISSVRPFDLMIGKIIGVGLVGITQIFLWGLLLAIFGSIGGLFLGEMFSSNISVTDGMQQGLVLQNEPGWLNQLHSFNFYEILFFFILFFIGGYLLYASVFAAIGSAVNTAEDSQQFMVPITIMLIFALYAGMYGTNNPDGPLAFWCSIIPFTSPIVMLMRIPFEIPLWEKLLSVILLYATALSLTWVSAKIYRVGILMYGKKPHLKEIAKWITFK